MSQNKSGVEENEQQNISRRGFVSNVATAAMLPLLAQTKVGAQTPALQPDRTLRPAPAQSAAKLITRQREPENLEFNFATLDSLLTPNDRFYVRSHFATPNLDAEKWQLRVEGAVERPFTISYAELQQMPSRKLQTTLECAGNGRVALVPPANGVQWDQGGVSTAEWTGVSLSMLLARAGIRPEAVEVVLEGADSGEIKTTPRPAGAIHYARSLPLERARQQDVILATKMNGSDLPVSHGFPVRAVVPGWYGMASVKWLTRILVLPSSFQGYFQTIDYAIWERQEGVARRVLITSMQVKASIARPSFRESIRAGSGYRIYGAAWAGETAVTKVEISINGGQSWQPARLSNLPVPYTWRFWEYEWRVPMQPGRYAIMARATDAKGNAQSMQRDADRENYMINHVLPVEVEVA